MGTTNSLTTAIRLTPYLAGGNYPFPVVNLDWLPATLSYTPGTAAGSIDRQAQGSVTATTSGASIQLNAGSLVNQIGESQSFARVDGHGYYNAGTNACTITGAFIAANYGTNGLSLPPGGQFAHAMGGSNSASGMAAGTGTNSTLTFTSAGTAGTTSIQYLIAGRSV